jgi:predicted N-acyltransferase
MLVKKKFIEKISDLSNIEFKNISKKNNSPFMSYEFLDAIETSGSASPSSGWRPYHMTTFKNEALNGFMPLYLKNNSQGEFVFDHQWSYALQRANRKYYPKFLSAIPFTPCETSKLVAPDMDTASEMIETVKEEMTKLNIETWHVLYPDKQTKNMLKKNNFIERFDYRFVWNNRDFKNFDDFLKILTSRQRKNIKSERGKVEKEGVTFITKDKDSLSEEDWNIFFNFYANTYNERMQNPYLNIEFFKKIHRDRDNLNPVIFFAIKDSKTIAGSLCFEGDGILYGRHWGCSENIQNLHFECCYYQGIKHCIEKKIALFDPGIQGEYKIRRGFEPRLSSSLHFVLHEDFREAIQDFCTEERRSVDSYMQACREYTPIKKEYRIIEC